MIDQPRTLPRVEPLHRRQHGGRQIALHPADLILPTAIALWAFGVSQAHVAHLGPYGLPPALPVIFYVGLGLLVLSISAEIARAAQSPWRLAMHAVALIVMLYGTAPLVYSEGRYEWLYKTIGVVQYFNDHGQLNRSIDIYQNWPGFFAFAAWFDKVAGVATPLTYAKWAQLVVELASLPLLYLSYDALRLSYRHRWVAIFLYYASNWIGQDYFSPQALATVLSLGIMAIALRWLYTPSPGARRVPRYTFAALSWRHSAKYIARQPLGRSIARRARLDALMALSTRVRSRLSHASTSIVSALLLTYFVLTFTHQLSPYLLALQLGMLAALRFIEPRWLPLVLVAIALAYFLPRYQFVTSHFSILSIGDIFHNAAPPAFSRGSPAGPEQFIERCAEALSAAVWIAGAAGVWLRRRSGYPVLPLALLAYSPILMLAIAAYGQEGILRVYLFSLPWAAALASLAIVPPTRATSAKLAASTAIGSWRRSLVQLPPSAYRAISSWGRSLRHWLPRAWKPIAPIASLAIVAPAQAASAKLAANTAIGAWPRSVGQLLPRAWKPIPGLLSGVRRSVAQLLPRAWTPIPGLFSGVRRSVTQLLPRAWKPIAGLLSSARRSVARLLPRAWKPTAGLLSSARRSVARLLPRAWKPTAGLPLSSLRVPLALTVALAFFFPAFFGDDGFNRMTTTEVQTVTAFWQTVRPGPVYVPIDNAPVSDTGEYNLFPVTTIFGAYSLLGRRHVTSHVAELVQQSAEHYTSPGQPAYVLFTPNMTTYNQEYGSVPADSFSVLRRSLAQSPSWVLIYDRDGIVIYQYLHPQ